MNKPTRRSRSLSLLASLLAVSMAGCYANPHFRTSEVRYLDGYDAHNEHTRRELTGAYVTDFVPGRTEIHPTYQDEQVTDRPFRMLDTEGDSHDFNSERELYMVTDGGERHGGRMARVQVTEDRVVAETRGGDPIDLRLGEVDHVEMHYLDKKKTGIVAGVVGAVAMTVVLGVIVMRLDDPGFDEP